MDQNLAGLTYAACGLLIVAYAWARFNTPPSNRSSTRQALYWSSGVGYVLSALALFAALSILLKAGPWRKLLLGPADDPSLPAPLIATLAMTTLLPAIPALKRMDEWFLSIFLDWAEIPGEVRRRAAAMILENFSVTSEDVAALRQSYGEAGYGDTLTRHLRRRGGDGFEQSQRRLTRVVKLYDQLRKLSGEPRYARFFAEAASEFDDLDRKATDFLRRAAASLTLAERLREVEKEDAYDELVQERREDFANGCRDMFRVLALFLARAVLRSEASETGIVRRLRATGFDAAEPMNLPRFPIHSLTVLALGIFLYLLVAILFFGQFMAMPQYQQAGGLMIAAKVAVVRLGTIGVTVWLLQHYAFFRRASGDPPRFFAYVVAGLIAAAAAVVICLLFHLGDADPVAAAGGDLPMILLSFMLCAALAACCDDWVADRMPPAWLRLVEAAGCAAVAALGIGFVVTYLSQDLPFPTDQLTGSKLAMLFAFPSAMAFVIGACVPHIYRAARRAATARRDEASRFAADPRSSAPEIPSPGRDQDRLDAADAQHQQRSEQAGEAARQEGQQVVAGQAAHRARAKCRKRAADLVPGEDPRDDHRGVAAAEHFVGERKSGGAGGDPVETVKDREDRQADRVELGERHHDQRQAAQPVIPEQQHARVEAVAHPAGERGADQAEHAERGQDVGAGDLRDAAIGAIGDQMGVYQPVGR